VHLKNIFWVFFQKKTQKNDVHVDIWQKKISKKLRAVNVEKQKSHKKSGVEL